MGDLLDLARQAFRNTPPVDPMAAGMGFLDLLGRPGNAARTAVRQTADDVQSPQDLLSLVSALAPGGDGGQFFSTHPDIIQAAQQGLTGQRQTDPTELPGVGLLPDQGPSLGPIHVTPRTVAGFAAGTALDPVTYTPAGIGKGLEALPALSRLARPAEIGMQAIGHGAGAVQGAELVGRDPETGEVDPGRAALGAVAGLGVSNAGKAIGPAKRVAGRALDTGLETMDRVSPPEVAYARELTPDERARGPRFDSEGKPLQGYSPADEDLSDWDAANSRLAGTDTPRILDEHEIEQQKKAQANQGQPAKKYPYPGSQAAAPPLSSRQARNQRFAQQHAANQAAWAPGQGGPNGGGRTLIDKLGEIVGNPNVNRFVPQSSGNTSEFIDQLYGVAPKKIEDTPAPAGNLTPGPSEFPNQAAWQQASSGRSLGPLPHVPDVAPRPGEPPTSLAPGGRSLTIRPGGELTPNIPPSSEFKGGVIEQAKRDLAAAMYESGYERTPVFLEGEAPAKGEAETRSVIAPEGRQALSADEYQDEPMEKSDTRSPFRQAVTRIVATHNYPEEGTEGPPTTGPIGAVKGAQGSPGSFAEASAAIGRPRSGSTTPAMMSLEGNRFQGAVQERANQLVNEELARVGGDPRKSQWYHEVLDELARSATPKYDKKSGERLVKTDPQTGKPLTMEHPISGEQVPQYDDWAPLDKRIENGEYANGYKGMDRPKIEPGWQDTKFGKFFLRAIAGDILRSGSKYRGMSEKTYAEKLVRAKASDMAREAVNLGAEAPPTKKFSEEGGRKVSTAEAAADDEANVPSEDVMAPPDEATFNAERMDPYLTDQQREVDKTSYDATRGPQSGYDADAATSDYEYKALTEQLARDEKYLGELGDPKHATGFNKPVYDKDGNQMRDDLGRVVTKRKVFSEEETAKQISLAQARIEQARQRLSKMDAPSGGDIPDREPPGYAPWLLDTRVDSGESQPMAKGKKLPEGVRGTIHYAPDPRSQTNYVPPANPPVHGPWPMVNGEPRSAAPRTFTGNGRGRMPATRRQFESIDPKTGEPRDAGAELESLRKKYLSLSPDERVKQMSDAEMQRVVQSLPPRRDTGATRPAETPALENLDLEAGERDVTSLARPAGPTRTGQARESGATVNADTDYFKKRMAEIMDVMPRLAPGQWQFIEQPARSTWEDYMTGRLQRLMQGQGAA